MREITITLPIDVAHRLEIMAARDDNRMENGITQLLTYLVEQFENNKKEVAHD